MVHFIYRCISVSFYSGMYVYLKNEKKKKNFLHLLPLNTFNKSVLRTLPNIEDGAFGENGERLKAVNIFSQNAAS